MPSNLTFTSVSGGMNVTGTFDQGITGPLFLPSEHYQLMQLSSGTLWFKPLNGAYDIHAFTLAQVASPVEASIAALYATLLTMSSPNTSNMIPNGYVYVSDDLGNDSTGNGSLELPLQTINAGITLAETNTALYNVMWTVAVLPGNYDEQIAPTGVNIVIEFLPGASLLYSGAGASVDSTGQIVQIIMHLGSTLTHTNAGDVISCPANAVIVTGTGLLLTNSAGRLADVGVAGVLVLNDMALQGNGNSAELVNVAAGGTAKFTRCTFTQPDTNAAIVVNGAPVVNLDSCRFQCSGTEYVSSTGAETIQVVECVSNVAKGAGITETVGTTLVDAAYVI